MTGAARILRHRGVDRLNHWLTAAAVLTLLATSLLPRLGVEFEWVLLHWVTGILLILLILLHILRAVLRGTVARMWIGARDIAGFLGGLQAELAGSPAPPVGKYSFAQQLFHLAIAVLLVAAAVSGALLLVKIDSPFWTRDPYWLAADTWAVLYVLHDLVALLLIPALMLHVYFAIRPEKRHFTRSMLLGWILEEEYRKHHDPVRWAPEPQGDGKS